MKNFTKFKTENNIIFYYNNDTNSLHEINGDPIILKNNTDYSDYFLKAKETYNTRKKSKKVAALRMLMGHACNYSCTYCMQKDIGNPEEIPRRKNLDDFFENIKNNLDISELERVELWGGEPFLYWPDMVDIMKFFDREGMFFAIATNGSCLHQKHADFFKTLKSTVIISISHDGPRQLQLRGEEIFDRPRVISTLKEFDKLDNVNYSFQCSITNTNFDLFKINEFFRDQILKNNLDTWMLAFSLGRTYQEGNNFDYLPCNVIESENTGDKTSDSDIHVIHGENLEKFRIILSNFLEAHYQQYTRFGMVNGEPGVFSVNQYELPLLFTDIYEGEVAYSVVEYSKRTITGEPILESTNCGADNSDILSLDLEGNVRTCPHAGEKHIHGTINNLKGIRIISLDLNRKDNHCTDCVNKKLCHSSCPISFPDETFLTNCRVEKVWYGEIQKAAFRFLFQQKIEVLKYGLEKIDLI